MRKSTTHPLRIDAIPIGQAGGSLGLTFCPGKKQIGAMTGDWDRDLTLDLDSIVDWQADSILTLVETSELSDLQVPNLGEDVRKRGIEWFHMPIVDQSIPNGAWETRWIYVGEALRQRLAAGGRVLIHCKGGMGRAGTIAARLLVEFGTDPESAIQQVRRARRGTIETAGQEGYVRTIEPIPDAGSPHSLRSRILGCLLGGAVGDAMGYIVEFSRWKKIEARFGPDGLAAPPDDGSPLTVSDDTQMTLFTLEGLLRGIDTYDLLEQIRLAYCDWGATQGQAGNGWQPAGELHSDALMQRRRAPGMTCLAAIDRDAACGTPAHPLNDSKGCGGVMRVAPLGFLAGRRSLEAIRELGERAAAMTHGHVDGFKPAGDMAQMIAALILCRDEHSIADALPGKSADPSLTAAALAHREADLDICRGQVARLGEGWVGDEALAIGLFSFLAGANDYRRTIRIACNHCGDSDSTASFAGQLYGARHGVAGIPSDWIMRLDVLEPLLWLAGEFIRWEASH